MMRKDFRLFQFYLLDDLLGIRKCRVVSSEEIFRKPENCFDDALSLLQKLMADFVLVNARSPLLEVIFLLVQMEAQYNLDTINNIFTVSVVKWGSRIFIL